MSAAWPATAPAPPADSRSGDKPAMTSPENLRLQNVWAWLGDLQPAWTVLERASIDALLNEPSSENPALRLAPDLTADEVALSPVARNALVLLREASGRGLKLTPAGSLPRATVAAMEEAMAWPGRDPADSRRGGKVLNEADFTQLHFLRKAAETAGLAERERSRLHTTRLGRRVLKGNGGALQAILFHFVFWRSDLSPFGRGLLGAWPQDHIGVVLWSLSVAADGWQPPETLSRVCTVPCDGIFEAERDIASLILQARILAPLHWFGLVERRGEDEAAGVPGEWRKSALFGRFLKFEVRLEDAVATRH